MSNTPFDLAIVAFVAVEYISREYPDPEGRDGLQLPSPQSESLTTTFRSAKVLTTKE